MAQIFMPTCKVGSPVAVLTGPITASSTYIPFNTAILPAEAEGICSVGTELDFETIHYTSKDAGGVYTTNGGHRGYDGTTAKSWAAGTQVGRFISNYDMYAMRSNIGDHETRVVAIETDLPSIGANLMRNGGPDASTGWAGSAVGGATHGYVTDVKFMSAGSYYQTCNKASGWTGHAVHGPTLSDIPFFDPGKPYTISVYVRSDVAAPFRAYITGAYVVNVEATGTVGKAIIQPNAPTGTVVAGGSLPAEAHKVVVTALNENGETLASDASADITPDATNKTIRVTWSAVDGATGYNVYMGAASGGISYSVIRAYGRRQNTTPITGTTYDVTSNVDNGRPPRVSTAEWKRLVGTGLAPTTYCPMGSDESIYVYPTGAYNGTFWVANMKIETGKKPSAFVSSIADHDHSGNLKGPQLAYSGLSGIPTTFAPTAHATAHKTGGADAIKLDELAVPTDVTTLNATTSLHGLLMKATAAASGNRNVLAIDNGETTYKCTALFDATNPAALGTAGPGTSLFVARRDHVHPMPSDGDISNWTVGPAFTRTADSTFTVTDNATNQGIFAPGRPIRYKDTAGAYRYGIVVGYSSGTVTLAGGAMTTSYDAIVEYADFNRVVKMDIFIPGMYADADNTALIASDLKSSKEWRLGPAYLVNVRLKSNTIDSPGADGYVNVLLGGAPICTATTTFGIMMNSTAWKDSAVAVDVTNYSTTFGDAIEIAAYKGYTGNAADLTVVMLFVLV